MAATQKMIQGHRVEIAEVASKFLVWINDSPILRPNAKDLPEEEKQARFPTSRIALKAAEIELNWRRRRII